MSQPAREALAEKVRHRSPSGASRNHRPADQAKSLVSSSGHFAPAYDSTERFRRVLPLPESPLIGGMLILWTKRSPWPPSIDCVASLALGLAPIPVLRHRATAFVHFNMLSKGRLPSQAAICRGEPSKEDRAAGRDSQGLRVRRRPLRISIPKVEGAAGTHEPLDQHRRFHPCRIQPISTPRLQSGASVRPRPRKKPAWFLRRMHRVSPALRPPSHHA